MKWVMLLLLLLAACATPPAPTLVTPAPVETDQETAVDVQEIIKESDDILTFSILWHQGSNGRLIVVEDAISKTPASISSIDLLTVDGEAVKAILQTHRDELLSADQGSCLDNEIIITINGVKNTVCEDSSPAVIELMAKIRDLERRYYPEN